MKKQKGAAGGYALGKGAAADGFGKGSANSNLMAGAQMKKGVGAAYGMSSMSPLMSQVNAKKGSKIAATAKGKGKSALAKMHKAATKGKSSKASKNASKRKYQ